MTDDQIIVALFLKRPDLFLIVGFLKLSDFLISKFGMFGVVFTVGLPLLILWVSVKIITFLFNTVSNMLNKDRNQIQGEPVQELTFYKGEPGQEPDEAIVMTKYSFKNSKRIKI